jgi:catechol 2,3-dioxygenase-like lactoylglutathione lyase family enzyme
MIKGRKLDHIGLAVTDIEASRAWYCDVLGFAVIGHFYSGTTPVYFLKNGETVYEMFEKDLPETLQGKIDHISFVSNDIEADYNDLDAHCIEPNFHEIFFRTDKKPRMSTMGGQLDVDIIEPMENKAAVENITWNDINKMKDGSYQFFVNCYSNRGGRSGFRAEIEFDGQIYSFDYKHPLNTGENIMVATVNLKNGKFTILPRLECGSTSRTIWGISTNEFVPVSVICYSPNYWDKQNGIGNKHYFFMLKDCINDELPNAWYNEFLNNELYPAHRKVMEALSSKAHVNEADDQLSGLGFSSTLRNELVVKVKGSTERILKITF